VRATHEGRKETRWLHLNCAAAAVERVTTSFVGAVKIIKKKAHRALTQQQQQQNVLFFKDGDKNTLKSNKFVTSSFKKKSCSSSPPLYGKNIITKSPLWN
jgi:hypothetical protein